ncbi:MAG: hypothetical protein MUE74_05015 [Bacteroidales bacterium]|nr:hypothetical protein [Bacteroidales bacterium]
MLKRRAATITIIALILGVVAAAYFLQKGKRTLLNDPWKAVGGNAVFVIETIDLQSFVNSITTEKGLFGEIGRIKDFESFRNKTRFLADKLGKPAFSRTFAGNTALISFYPHSGGKIRPLLSMSLQSGIRLRHIKDMLRDSGIRDVDEKMILTNPSLFIPYSSGSRRDTVFLTVVSGLFLCTTSETIAKEAIIQITRTDNVRTHPGFEKVLMASGKNEDKVFIIFNNLVTILKPFIREGETALLQSIRNLASCGSGDIYLSENDLVLSGYTESTDPSQHLYKYKSAAPGLFHTARILPASTVFLESILNPPAPSGKAGDSKAANLASKLRPYIGEEITRALIDIRERPYSDNSVVIYELHNRAYAEKVFLDDYSVTAGNNNISYFQPDEQVRLPVYQTDYKGFNSAVIPGFTNGFSDVWFAFYDNFLITGSSYATVSRLLYDNLLNKTLSNDVLYRDFESTLPSIAGYFFYAVPSRSIDFLSQWLDEDLIKALRENKSSLAKIQAVGYQFVNSNNMLYNSLSVRFREEVKQESPTEWETLLDTVAAIKPFFFTNHLTGAKEIFIQDMMNNAYLINVAGRVLWKVPLRERITSPIYMVDYARNGKYQLLFSGKNHLHLLDRNGNYVERYPVQLRSPSSNPLALFDYDGNRNYRLLIAGEDKLVYAYDINGNVVRGWNPFRTTSQVKSEVSWIRVSGKDYLLISDQTALYFIDRTGNTRLTLKEPVTKAEKSSVRLVTGTRPYVACSSPEGVIQQVYFDGSVRTMSTGKYSVDHSFDIFDVNGDGFGEYIFIDKGILYLYNHNGNEIFRKEFGSDNLGGPINFVFSATDRKIGVFDVDKNLIYLVDRNGNTMKGFPLKGASMFSIGKLSEKSGWHLIVGGTDRFLYNYKLDTK